MLSYGTGSFKICIDMAKEIKQNLQAQLADTAESAGIQYSNEGRWQAH